MYKFSFAKIDRTEELMLFMHNHWRADHILAQNRELFLYDFQDGDNLNIGIAEDEQGNIAGIFGFMRYNSLEVPDIAGSLWKVIENPTIPMLGLKLRNFVVNNVKHRFFAAPGAGLQTKPIYRMLNMNWHRMEQHFILNQNYKEFKIALIPDNFKREESPKANQNLIKEISNISELKNFPFETFRDEICPYKDIDYVQKRYFENPFRNYKVYGYYSEDENIESLIVFRDEENDLGKVCRIVDFLGNENTLPNFSCFLNEYLIQNDMEYVDFINHGLDEDLMRTSGFNKVNFETNEVIIPNYFAPFERKNVPVYCVSDKTNLKFRQMKADGDQDRPNFI